MTNAQTRRQGGPTKPKLRIRLDGRGKVCCRRLQIAAYTIKAPSLIVLGLGKLIRTTFRGLGIWRRLVRVTQVSNEKHAASHDRRPRHCLPYQPPSPFGSMDPPDGFSLEKFREI